MNTGKLVRKAKSHRQRIARFFTPTNEIVAAFHVDGGMGDHVLAARFIRDFTEQAEKFRFHVYTRRPELMDWLLADLPGFDAAFERKADWKMLRLQYAFVIDVFTCLNIRTASKGLRPPKLQQIISTIERSTAPLRRFITQHPDLDGYLASVAMLNGFRRHTFNHHLAGLAYNPAPLQLEVDGRKLIELDLKEKKYITVSNGYDDNIKTTPGSTVTKVFSNFSKVISLLRHHFGDSIGFIQIGVNSSTAIPGIDHNLIGQTSLQEVAGLLKAAICHLDNEGGLVHLADALGTQSVVVFGPTPADYFGYERNMNAKPPKCGGCWWMQDNWMTHCIRVDENMACMKSHSEEDIASMVKSILSQTPAK